MSRILVTGAAGQLGQDLLRLQPDALGIDIAELDLTDALAVRAFLAADRPEVVIHGAAYTAVDRAEEDEDTAFRVNATASANLATACAATGSKLIAVSTDYVFPGDGDAPYEPSDPTGPKSAYGRTKLAGERAVREILPTSSWVVRTAWVWGQSGNNFVKTMARLEKTKPTLDVVDDQRGTPTWSRDLAAGLLELAGRPDVAPGTLHLTGGGETTWCGFARAIFAELGADPERVHATTSAAYPQAAARPSYSVLSPQAWIDAGLTPARDWREALAVAFADPDVSAALRGG